MFDSSSYMKKKILIIEDDLSFRYMLQRSLIELNLEILATDNGHVGLEILRSDPKIHLVVTNIVMPILSGIEFRKLQLLDQTIRHIPIVFLAGHQDHFVSNEELDFHIILMKPVMPDDFKVVVENIIFN